MFFLTCTMISSIDLAHYERPRAKDLIIWRLWYNYTAKNIRIFYGKIIGNQLPVHFPLFFTGARNYFQESGTVR